MRVPRDGCLVFRMWGDEAVVHEVQMGSLRKRMSTAKIGRVLDMPDLIE